MRWAAFVLVLFAFVCAVGVFTRPVFRFDGLALLMVLFFLGAVWAWVAGLGSHGHR